MGNPLESLRAEIESLKANRVTQAAAIRELQEYVDTVSSPLWKRWLWVLQGYRFRRVGRWYGKTAELR